MAEATEAICMRVLGVGTVDADGARAGNRMCMQMDPRLMYFLYSLYFFIFDYLIMSFDVIYEVYYAVQKILKGRYRGGA